MITPPSCSYTVTFVWTFAVFGTYWLQLFFWMVEESHGVVSLMSADTECVSHFLSLVLGHCEKLWVVLLSDMIVHRPFSAHSIQCPTGTEAHLRSTARSGGAAPRHSCRALHGASDNAPCPPPPSQRAPRPRCAALFAAPRTRLLEVHSALFRADLREKQKI